jgi:hypothetical protein
MVDRTAWVLIRSHTEITKDGQVRNGNKGQIMGF